MIRTIAVIGAKGFVGSAICRALEARREYRLVRICRGDDISRLAKPADIVIHAANSAKRFWAENNQQADFVDTVEKTARIKELSRGKKIVLVSTVSARLQLQLAYGRHRRACELIVQDGESLIVRLGPMFGEGKEVGALHDILNNRPCYVSEATRYAYVPVEYNAQKIVELVEQKGIVELGARNAIALGELKRAVGSDSVFSGPDDSQLPINPPADAPDAQDAIAFALSLKKAMK